MNKLDYTVDYPINILRLLLLFLNKSLKWICSFKYIINSAFIFESLQITLLYKC
jgi:hypothetical protein